MSYPYRGTPEHRALELRERDRMQAFERRIEAMYGVGEGQWLLVYRRWYREGCP